MVTFKSFCGSVAGFVGLLSGLSGFLYGQAKAPITWQKHVIAEQGHCNTAVALDANGDSHLDVIAGSRGKVTLFIGPSWQQQIVLYRFPEPASNCIHSAVLDVDQDGDLDWAGADAQQHPFWLENPGREHATQGAWTARWIDQTLTAIHCLTAADINKDGQPDLVINNFKPDAGLRDSIAWFEVPADPRHAREWHRHIFAAQTARGGSHYMGVGDVDGDGWSEIAVGAKGAPFEDGNWFAFWKNPGTENRAQGWQKHILATEQPGATNILSGDVNRDGKLDWIASRGHGVGLIWFENPSWKMHTIDDQLEFPHSLALGDFDMDGDVDAASCGFGSERVMWYENLGGTFLPHRIDVQQQSYDLRSVDLDGDGDQDLLNAGRATGNVVWYENLRK